jgi:hypothetical protein
MSRRAIVRSAELVLGDPKLMREPRMKKRSIRRLVLALFGLALLLSLARPQHAQSGEDYALSAAVFHAGGRSSGDGWSLEGVVGQPAVAALSGSGCVLEGGFVHSGYGVHLPLVLRG